MQPSSSSGRPLPGWGSSVRRRASHTALALAALAGLSLTGCQAPAATPTGLASVSVTSAPARLRGALALARRHLDVLPLAASHPYHLVAFAGRGLDDQGATIAAAGSDWQFTFSRYNEPGPTQSYDVVTVTVPGSGPTRVVGAVSQDAALSPIENWDDAVDAAAPDSSDLLAPLRAAGVATAGATITLTQGEVKIAAGGKQTVYDPRDNRFSAVEAAR